MKKLMTLGVLALCLGLFSYGCGGGDAPKAPASTPASTPAAPSDDVTPAAPAVDETTTEDATSGE